MDAACDVMLCPLSELVEPNDYSLHEYSLEAEFYDNDNSCHLPSFSTAFIKGSHRLPDVGSVELPTIEALEYTDMDESTSLLSLSDGSMDESASMLSLSDGCCAESQAADSSCVSSEFLRFIYENEQIGSPASSVNSGTSDEVPDIGCLSDRLQFIKQESIPTVVSEHHTMEHYPSNLSNPHCSRYPTKTSSLKYHRKRTNRRMSKSSRVYHLWEFIRDLLLNPENSPRVISWLNRAEGVFKILQSEEVARRWGVYKTNKKTMTYEKMSRAIRFSRKVGYFDEIDKDGRYPKKLCFKFGSRTHGWQENHTETA